MDAQNHLSKRKLKDLARSGKVLVFLTNWKNGDNIRLAEKKIQSLFGQEYQIHDSDEFCKMELNMEESAVVITDDWDTFSGRSMPPNWLCFHLQILDAVQEMEKLPWNGKSIASTLLTNEKVFFHGYPCSDEQGQASERAKLEKHNARFIFNPQGATLIYVSRFRRPLTLFTTVDGMPDPKQLFSSYIGGALVKTKGWLDRLSDEGMVHSAELCDRELTLEGLSFYVSTKLLASTTLTSSISSQGGEVSHSYHDFCQLVKPDESESEDEECFPPDVILRFKQHDRPCIKSDFILRACSSSTLDTDMSEAFAEAPRLKPFYRYTRNELVGRRVFAQEDVTGKKDMKAKVRRYLKDANVTLLENKLREDTVFCNTLSLEPVQPHYHSLALLEKWLIDGPLEPPLPPWHCPIYIPAKLYTLFKDNTFAVFGNSCKDPEVEFEIAALHQMGARPANIDLQNVTEASLNDCLIFWDGVEETPRPLFGRMLHANVPFGNVFRFGFAGSMVAQLSFVEGDSKILVGRIKSKFQITDAKTRAQKLQKHKTCPLPPMPFPDEIVSSKVDIPGTFVENVGAQCVELDSTPYESTLPSNPSLFTANESFIFKTPSSGRRDYRESKLSTHVNVMVGGPPSARPEDLNSQDAAAADNTIKASLPLIMSPIYKSTHGEFGILGEARVESLLVDFSGAVNARLVNSWTYAMPQNSGDTADNFRALSVLPGNGIDLFKCRFYARNSASLSELTDNAIKTFVMCLKLLLLKPLVAKLDNLTVFIVKNGNGNLLCATLSIDGDELTAELRVKRRLMESYYNLPSAITRLMPFQLGIQCEERFKNLLGSPGCFCSTIQMINKFCIERVYSNARDSCFSECAMVLQCPGTDNSNKCRLRYCFGILGMRELEIAKGDVFDMSLHKLERDCMLEVTCPHKQFVCAHCYSKDYKDQPATKIGKVLDFGERAVCLGTSCRMANQVFYMLAVDEMPV